jgi:hypothetical protein
MFSLVFAGCKQPTSDSSHGGGGSGSGGGGTPAALSDITGFTFTPNESLQVGTASVDAGKTVGTVSSPVGGTTPYTYSLVSGVGDTDNALFTMSGTSLKVGPSALTTAKTYSVRIQITDSTGKTYAHPCTFTVAAQNAPALTGTVTMSGNAIVGRTLTADTTKLTGSGAISYKWLRNSSEISGANGDAYTVVAADVGDTITVQVSRTGYTGSITSLPTKIVVYPALTGTVSITGTARAGKILTADTSALKGAGAITYQWLRNGLTLVGGDSTYALVAADVGYTISLSVSRAGYSGTIKAPQQPW